MPSNIATKDRVYRLHFPGGSTRTLSAAAAQRIIDTNIAKLKRVRPNRVTFRTQHGCAWLVPANPSRGAAFKVGA